jgi:tetratricopeptide (TPR) repeat protein
MRKMTGIPSNALQSASMTDILRVAESVGLQQDCRWFQRLGFTIHVERDRYKGDEQSSSPAVELKDCDMQSLGTLTYQDAIGMYRKACKIDDGDGMTRSSMAHALASQDKYEEAAREASAAVELYVSAIQNGKQPPKHECSFLSSKIAVQQAYASYCIKAGNLDEAFRAYEGATQDLETLDTTGDAWEEIVPATAYYFYGLTSNKKWTDAELLIRRLNTHAHRSSESFHLIYRYIAYSENQLLQIGYHTKNLTTLTDFMNHALSSTARHYDESAVASVVHTFANILLRLDKERVDDAVSMLEAVFCQTYTFEYIKGWAERELARHFLTRALQEREDDHWQAVAHYAEKLLKLVFGDELDPTNSNTESRESCRMLAAWYQINGLRNRAMQCVRTDVHLGIDLLSDTDPDNDTMAWHTLMDSLLAIGDTSRAVAAVNMLRSGQFGDPKPSGKTFDAPLSDGENTARTDGDTRAGAIDETSGNSQSAQDDGASAPASLTTDGQLRTVSTSSVEHANTKQESEIPTTPEEGESSIDRDTRPTVDLPDENGRAQETQGSVASVPTLDPGYPFFSCDGCCFDDIANDAPMWRCSYCITDFCESCHSLIMDKKMTGWNVCDSLHRHVFVPRITRKYPKDIIRVGDDDKPVAEWVQELRGDWDYFKAGS